MMTLGDVIVLTTLLGITFSAITIPDSISEFSRRYVYHHDRGTWQQADRVCRHGGGQLVLVDGQAAADQMTRLTEAIDRYSLSDIHTRMVRHDDGTLYADGASTCQVADLSHWGWTTASDAVWDPASQCVLAEKDTLAWRKVNCDHDDEFVCEYQHGSCDFQTTSVSLASLPMTNASMAACQATCRQMIGCFATAPSGHATLPPYTHCLFIVTGDYSNTMTSFDCPDNVYEEDYWETDPNDFPPPPADMFYEGHDPKDCVPDSSTREATQAQRPLRQFLQESNYSVECATTTTTTITHPSTFTQTAYVTLTPDVIMQTAYVTLTPEVQTAYVTLDMQTAYVTLTPEVQTAHVPASPVVLTASVSCSPAVPSAPFFIITTATTTTTTITSTSTQTQALPVTACPLPSQQQPQTTITASCPTIPTTTTTAPTTTTTTTTTPTALKSQRAEEEILAEIVKGLKVDTRNVSRTRRSKQSAKDERASAQSLGLGAGLVLVLVSLLLVLSDLPTLYQDLRRMRGGGHRRRGRGPGKESSNEPV